MVYIFLVLILILFILVINKNKKEYFKNELKISVLILSYNRPWNLEESIPKLLKLNKIDDITIYMDIKILKTK